MKIEATNRFICTENIPHYSANQIVEETDDSIQYSSYPKIFKRLYQFEDGEIVYEGLPIFRVMLKGQDFYIKTSSFTPSIHIPNIEIFSTELNAKKRLKELELVQQEKWKSSNYENKLQYISTLLHNFDVKEKSISEIQHLFNKIKDATK